MSVKIYKTEDNCAAAITSISKTWCNEVQKALDNAHEILQKRRPLIYGAGTTGTMLGWYLEKKRITDFVYTDQDAKLWEKHVNGYKIISLNNYKEEAKNYFAFVTPANVSGGNNLFLSLGLKEYKDYVFVNGKSAYREYIKALKSDYDQNGVFVIADCLWNACSIAEKERMSLRDFFQNKVGNTHRMNAVAIDNLSSGVAYYSYMAHREQGIVPKCVLVVVDLRNFNGKSQLVDSAQHVSLMEKLYELYHKPELKYYVEEAKRRELNMKGKVRKSTAIGKRSDFQNRMYLTVNYYYNLQYDCNEELLYIKKLLSQLESDNVNAVLCFMPINYEKAEEIMGGGFVQQVKKDMNSLLAALQSYSFDICDITWLLGKEYFPYPAIYGETWNVAGSEKVSEILYNKIQVYG